MEEQRYHVLLQCDHNATLMFSFSLVVHVPFIVSLQLVYITPDLVHSLH